MTLCVAGENTWRDFETNLSLNLKKKTNKQENSSNLASFELSGHIFPLRDCSVITIGLQIIWEFGVSTFGLCRRYLCSSGRVSAKPAAFAVFFPTSSKKCCETLAALLIWELIGDQRAFKGYPTPFVFAVKGVCRLSFGFERGIRLYAFIKTRAFQVVFCK